MWKMNDIHMHIIPDVDDGAWNQEMAEIMIYKAYFQGINKVIATPHSSAYETEEDREKVLKNFESLSKWTEEKLPDFKLYQGSEIYCSEYGIQNMIKKIKEGLLPMMNGTKYVLAEFSTHVNPTEVFACIEQFIKNEYVPIIAHVERCKYLFSENNTEGDKTDYLKQLKEQGCLFQINVYSVYEETNDTIRENANTLLAQKMVDFLGSDAHRTFHRPPSVEKGLAFMYDHYEAEYVDEIAYKNAEKYLLI